MSFLALSAKMAFVKDARARLARTPTKDLGAAVRRVAIDMRKAEIYSEKTSTLDICPTVLTIIAFYAIWTPEQVAAARRQIFEKKTPNGQSEERLPAAVPDQAQAAA